jgi:ligand-binding sensor domain-containing protein
MTSGSKSIILVFLFFLPLLVKGQVSNIRFEHISSENTKIVKGLSQNTVYCMMQDSKGFLWFGTWDGLNKFDGYNFTVYYPNYINRNRDLSNQTIRSVYEDSDGDIWIGTEGGLNKLNKQSLLFTQYKYNPAEKYCICNDTIISIVQDKNGILWFGTRNGLSKFDKKSNKFITYRHNSNDKNSLSNNRINNILPGKDDLLWVATEKGLNVFNTVKGLVVNYYCNTFDLSGLSSDTIHSLSIDKDSMVWVGTENGLDIINLPDKMIIHFHDHSGSRLNIGDCRVNSLYLDKDDNLWIGTFGAGIFVYNKENGDIFQYYNEPNNENSLAHNDVYSIIEDNSGIIWVCTAKGANKIIRNANKFNLYQFLSNTSSSLNNNIIWGFFEDEANVLWIATDKGINKLDRNTGQYTYLVHDKYNENSLSSNNVRNIYRDRTGIYWIGTYGYGLNKFDPKTGKFTRYLNSVTEKTSLSNDYVYNVCEDTAGNIWIATGGGICKLDIKTNTFYNYVHDNENKNSLSHNLVFTLYFDKAGYLWACTYDGLNKIDLKNRKFTIYRHESDNINSISDNSVFTIYEDKKGIFWIGTFKGGLNQLNPSTGEIYSYTEKDGLPNNMVYAILEDNRSHLWLSTNNGLSRFDKNDHSFVNYDVNDGLQSHEFNFGAGLKNKRGELFFGGMNGFNSFMPEEVIRNVHVPTVVITAFKIFSEIQKKEICDGDTIRLSHNQNFFSFEFAALDFRNPFKNKYAYKLENYDKYWNYCDADRRFAEYTKVSPGTYRLIIKGTNNEGLWNEEGISVLIIVKPAWWNTWVFRIASAISMIFVLWLFIYRRVRLIRKRNLLEKKMLNIEKHFFELEQKALQLQMNPHFIFNSLNSIQSFILNNNVDKAVNYLSKFSQLMRMILANSREPEISVQDEIKALNYYLELEKLRFDNKFDYFITVDKGIDAEFVALPPMIIQPYVENAILHGINHLKDKGKISITFVLQNQNIICTIDDNGVGREKAAEIERTSGLTHKPRGIMIINERIDLINKQNIEDINIKILDLKDSSGLAIGTRIVITLPIKEI